MYNLFQAMQELGVIGLVMYATAGAYYIICDMSRITKDYLAINKEGNDNE